MAEYKYRALGWKDDDIASLNVVDGTAADGTAADNQVVLQITKQGAGGTIDGPAIVGKDGITINKAADSEKIEISGSGCVQNSSKKGYVVYTRENDVNGSRTFATQPVPNSFPIWNTNNELEGNISNSSTDYTLTNKKYVDDNYVKKDTSVANQQVYGHDANGNPQMFYVTTGNSNPNWLCKYQESTSGATKPSGNGRLITQDPTQPYQAANKHYVDETDKDLRLKLSNLEQALNGYILDTTKEAYADLDSAVLKNSVAIGGNVYPIADKTRALVSRIEGKTTKMVQMLDRSKFSATTTINGVTFTNNGNGSVTVTGTPVDGVWEAIYSISNLTELIKGHKYLLSGCPEGGNASTYMLRLNVYNPANHGWEDYGNGCIFIFDIESYDRNSGGIYIYERTVGTEVNHTYTPQLFDLTAMNREDITTVEQFKAEFPEFYSYENGNIYPAKISGVKFTGKNLLDFKTVSAMKGNPMGISYSVVGNEVHIVGTLTQLGSVNIIKTSNLGLVGHGYKITVFDIRGASAPSSVVLYGLRDVDIYGDIALNITSSGMEVGQHYDFYFKVMVSAITPTAYEPYTEPVSVTLPETYDLHGIGDYKDYLEITKNEDNELYTLKKVQVIDKHVFDGSEYWSSYGSSDFTNLAYGTASLGSKFINWQSRASLMNLFNRIGILIDAEGYAHGDTSADLYIRLPNIATPAEMKAHVLSMYEAGTPYIFYGAIATPVETVIATNLTYEQVTAVRHNGGLIEVEGNTNKGYAKPTVTNTIVYRLTATNTTEG